MMEVWNPLGIIGVITAFNFPVAVGGWNTAIALICGNSLIWKGAEASGLVTVACGKIVTDVLKKNGFNSVFTVCQGDGKTIGAKISNDKRIPLVSFTGSTATGKIVSTAVHERFGKTILELGGNNGIIVMPDADIDMCLKGNVFAAVGTAGQRCTSLRRIFLHESVYDEFVKKMVAAYKTIKPGSPLDTDTLLGPINS